MPENNGPYIVPVIGKSKTLVVTAHADDRGKSVIRLSTKNLAKIYKETVDEGSVISNLIRFLRQHLVTFRHILDGEDST